MTAILIGIVWVLSLTEVFRIGYFLGKRKPKPPSVETVTDRERQAAEKAARELNNMLTYDGSEQE